MIIHSVLRILDGQLKSEVLHLSLTRRETFDRYAAKHDEPAKMTTRFACARCQTVAYCCKGFFSLLISFLRGLNK
jgi:hypothetical protein